MTPRRRLLAVLSELVEMLGAHGHDDEAAWLAAREAVLRSPASTAEVRRAKDELHAIVPGMGGLIDLPMRDLPSTSRRDARARLLVLADRLYELTR